jgi:DNA-binding beta-propeller fold protein YncE
MRLIPPALLSLAVGLPACRGSAPLETAEVGRSAGSLAVSADGSRLYLADEDNDALVVVDPSRDAERVVARMAVGDGPQKVLVAPDGRVFTANRYDRTVSLVDPSGARATVSIPVGAEPVALSLSADAKTLFVANHTDRSLSIVDVAAARETRRLPLPGDPTGLKVAARKAYVAFGRAASLAVVDTATGETVAAPSLELSPDKTANERRIPGQAADPVVNADEGFVYVPLVQSKGDLVATDMPGAYANGVIPVVAPATATLDASTERVVDTPAVGGGSCFECVLPATATPADGAAPALAPASVPTASPSAAVLDKSGGWLFVANLASANISIVGLGANASSMAPTTVRVGHGPSGIGLSPDGRTAYVHNAFDHTVSVLEPRGGVVTATREFVVGTSPLTPQQQLGRQLFHAADDGRMSNSATGGIACASCHPGGRDDGRTWQFSEGPRNTPTLAGRGLSRTAPYHWDGALKDFPAFHTVVEQRMGGTGLNDGFAGTLAAGDFDAMLAWLETLPAPDNPRRGAADEARVNRGRGLFEGKAQCAGCHAGPDRTDEKFHDVGTVGDGERFARGVNTPPLHGLFDSAPYLHDGSAATLRDRLLVNPGDRHGVTSSLSPDEVDDLVAYLEQL